MSSLKDLKNLTILKSSKAIGTQFVIKLEDNITIFIHDKKTNLVNSITIVKDKRTADKYNIKSDSYKGKFIANGDPQMIFFNPVIIAKIGAATKSKENIYFAVDSNIDLYA